MKKEVILKILHIDEKTSSWFSTLIYVYLTQDKCSVLLLKLSFFSLQTHSSEGVGLLVSICMDSMSKQ